MLRAGDLREHVTIQQKTNTANGQGGRTSTWSTLATVFAKVEAVDGAETIAAGGVTALQRYRVTIRYRADVGPTNRISWTPYLSSTARTLEVHSAPPPNREWLVLECAEVAN
jgi:SPP1 family predicted phage head-tail adaptor